MQGPLGSIGVVNGAFASMTFHGPSDLPFAPGPAHSSPRPQSHAQILDSLAVGDEISVKGPIGHFVYEGRGEYVMHGKHRGSATHLSMLAGGTGGFA